MDLADIVKRPAVGAPHRRTVLAGEVGQSAIVRTVRVADPNVVVGRAAIALTIPETRTTNVSNMGAVRRVDAVFTLVGADAMDHAALDGHGVQLEARRKGGGVRRSEKKLCAMRRRAVAKTVIGIEGQARRIAAARRHNEDVI